MDNAGNADLSVANSVFAYCLNTAGHEPLDQAAAAFAALGLFFAGAPPVRLPVHLLNCIAPSSPVHACITSAFDMS